MKKKILKLAVLFIIIIIVFIYFKSINEYPKTNEDFIFKEGVLEYKLTSVIFKDQRMNILKHHKAGNSTLVIENANEYLEFVPEDTTIWIILAENHIHEGELEKAEASIKKAFDLDPKSYWALRVLADVYMKKNESVSDSSESKYLSISKKYIEKALKIGSDDPYVNLKAAEIYFELGEADKALEFVNKTIKLEPSEEYFHFFKNRILNELNE